MMEHRWVSSYIFIFAKIVGMCVQQPFSFLCCKLPETTHTLTDNQTILGSTVNNGIVCIQYVPPLRPLPICTYMYQAIRR